MLLFLPLLRKSTSSSAERNFFVRIRDFPLAGTLRRHLGVPFLIALAVLFAGTPLEDCQAAIVMDTGGQVTSIGALPPTREEDGDLHLRTPERPVQDQNQEVPDLPWGIVPEVHYVWPPQDGGRPQWNGNQGRPPHQGVRPPNWSEDSGRPPYDGGRPPQGGMGPGSRPPHEGGRPPQWSGDPGHRPPYEGGRPPQWSGDPGHRPPHWEGSPGHRPPQWGGGHRGGPGPHRGSGAPSHRWGSFPGGRP